MLVVNLIRRYVERLTTHSFPVFGYYITGYNHSCKKYKSCKNLARSWQKIQILQDSLRKYISCKNLTEKNISCKNLARFCQKIHFLQEPDRKKIFLARILQDSVRKYISCKNLTKKYFLQESYKILSENTFLARTWQKKIFLARILQDSVRKYISCKNLTERNISCKNLARFCQKIHFLQEPDIKIFLARILQDSVRKYISCKNLTEKNISCKNLARFCQKIHFLQEPDRKKNFLQESCKIFARNTSNQNFDEKFEVANRARPFWIWVGKTSYLYFSSHLSVFCINYAPWALGYGQNNCSGTISIAETISGLNSTGYNDRKRAFPGEGE